MVKIFTLDENGKISFTKEELEKLLEEVEKEAFERGKESVKFNTSSPSLPPPNIPIPKDKSHWEDKRG